MQFLKTLFWVVIAVLFVLFAVANWTPTEIRMLGLIWSTKLPVPVIGAFLLGFVPLYLWHRAYGWRARRKVSSLENLLRPTPASTPAPASASAASAHSPLDLKAAPPPTGVAADDILPPGA